MTSKQYAIKGRQSTIFRVKQREDFPYVITDRRPIENVTLSYKAKGILTYLLSRPDGWEVNVPDLVNHGKEGASAIRSGLKELRDAHHVFYNPTREGGHIKKWVIEVYEIPYDLPLSEADEALAEKSLDDDFLHVDFLHVENRGEVLSTLSNNELKILSTEEEEENLPKIGKVFTFFEKNIQPLTPYVSETLGELIDEHTPHWVMEALKISIKAGVRKINHTTAILDRWKTEGYGTEKPNNKNYAQQNLVSREEADAFAVEAAMESI